MEGRRVTPEEHLEARAERRLPFRCHRTWTRFTDRWFAWEWKPTRWLHVSLDLTMMNIPRVHVDECRPRRWWSLSWGNGNSDAVWSIDVQLPDVTP